MLDPAQRRGSRGRGGRAGHGLHVELGVLVEVSWDDLLVDTVGEPPPGVVGRPVTLHLAHVLVRPTHL